MADNDLARYHKYKAKYLNLKNQINNRTTNQNQNQNHNYELRHYKNKEDQKNFIEKNLSRLVDLNIKCFPPNLEGMNLTPRQKTNAEKRYILARQQSFSHNAYKDWYFAMNNEKIIGFCVTDTERVYNIPNDTLYGLSLSTYQYKKIDTLEAAKLQKIEQEAWTDISPVIFSLCKDTTHKGVGQFLLKNVSQKAKQLGHKILYLIPESATNKCNYADTFNIKTDCTAYDPIKYKESNDKLIKYYKSNGFTISPTLYYIDWHLKAFTDYILFYNVMQLTL